MLSFSSRVDLFCVSLAFTVSIGCAFRIAALAIFSFIYFSAC